MARLFLLGLAIIAAGCTAGSATAPVSAAAIGAFELINLRELPIPRNVTSIYFEQPILGYAQAERTSCFFDRIGRFARAPIQGIDPYTARDQGLKIPPPSQGNPPCPETPITLSSGRTLSFFDKEEEGRVLAFLRDIRFGWFAELYPPMYTKPVQEPSRNYALHVMSPDQTLTIVMYKDFLEYVDARDRKRAVRRLSFDEIERL